MRPTGFVLIFVCLGANGARAATIQAQGCNSSQVAAAINSAADGDTVVVPAGTCTWTSPLTIGKSITLQGAGADATIIVDGIAAPSSGAKSPALSWKVTNNRLTRLTGFTFDGGSGGGDQSGHAGILSISGSSS